MTSLIAAYWKHGLAIAFVIGLITWVVFYLDARDKRNYAAGFAAAELECAEAQADARRERDRREAEIMAQERSRLDALQARLDASKAAVEELDKLRLDAEKRAERIRRDGERNARQALADVGVSDCRPDVSVLNEYDEAMRGLVGATDTDGIR